MLGGRELDGLDHYWLVGRVAANVQGSVHLNSTGLQQTALSHVEWISNSGHQESDKVPAFWDQACLRGMWSALDHQGWGC